MTKDKTVEKAAQAFIDAGARHAGHEPEQFASLDDDAQNLMRAAIRAAIESALTPTPSEGDGDVVERLREALKPFAKAAEHYENDHDDNEIKLPRSYCAGKDDWAPCLTGKDFRRAARALSTIPPLAEGGHHD